MGGVNTLVRGDVVGGTGTPVGGASTAGGWASALIGGLNTLGHQWAGSHIDGRASKQMGGASTPVGGAMSDLQSFLYR